MARRRKYSFTTQTETREGKVSLGLGIASAVILILMSLVSYRAGGEGGLVLGAAGLLGILLALYGLLLGVRGLAARHSKHGFAIAGALTCGIVALIWLTLFLLGVKH